MTLATPATTCRGLYMSATRGRDENIILVVTESHDIAEARDILDGILSNDRTDAPAITQRRELARQDRPAPVPQRRCEIPDWFHTVREGLVDRYHEARDAFEAAAAKRQLLADRIEIAQQRVRRADAECAPSDDRRRAAEADLSTAKEARNLAKRAVDESGVFGRRAVRADLSAADEFVERTADHLKQLNRIARDPDQQRDAAYHELRQAKDAVRSHDRFQQWEHLPQNLDAAQRGIDALDTWRDWADGRAMHHDRLNAAIDTLTAMPTARPLADVVERWADTHHVELRRPVRTVAREPIGMEIDL